MLCLLLSLIISRIEANTNNYSISGRISDERTGSPLPGASILIKGTYLWAVSDQKGEFTIQGIQEGKYQLEVSFLGYVPATVPVNVNNSIKGLKIQLKENTLALNDVIVTAQAPKSELNTTLNIGSNALEHLQISNVSDISALLPGGKTKVPDLTSNNIFSLRDGGSSAGNAAFGTAIEVDGVRIGNNSSFGNMTGIDTRSISVADIESVEVITGVPSAEYGDLNSGMVKIHTKKGKTPWNVLLSINPRTEQVSFSKGLDLGNDKGIVNISGEWIKATQKLNSPYTSYTRRGFSAGYSNTFRKVLRFDRMIPTHIRENIPKSETTFSVQTRHWHGCSTSHGLPTSNWMHRCITMITSRMHIHLILMRPNSRQSTLNRKVISLQANCLTISLPIRLSIPKNWIMPLR